MYLNLPNVLSRRLQMRVNAAARAICPYTIIVAFAITDFVRDELHSLPIVQRIQFNASTLLYKSLHDCGPANISRLIYHSTLATRRPRLRSSLRLNLILRRYRNKFSERACADASHLKWNSLYDHVSSAPTLTTFRKLFKVQTSEKKYS